VAQAGYVIWLREQDQRRTSSRNDVAYRLPNLDLRSGSPLAWPVPGGGQDWPVACQMGVKSLAPLSLYVCPCVLFRTYRVFTPQRDFLVKSAKTPFARSFARKSVCGRTVKELRERAQELVAYTSRGDLQVGEEKFSSCQERHGANRHDG